jgi:hypothetical protein
MLQFINYQIWFKVCRPIKRKYGLSSNCVLVLVAAYVLHSYMNRSNFTLRALQDHASYYNKAKIDSYIKVLTDKGYIIPSCMIKTRQQYSISEKGLQVIKELNDSYENEIALFCSLYNIVL